MNLTIPFIILLTLLSTSIKAATNCSIQTEIPPVECEALITLYTNTNGANWNDSPANNWNITNTPCSWTDVECTGGNVIIINRNAKNLLGTLSPTLGNLSKLRILGLSNNQLSGSIPPELGSLNNLRILSLSNNQLTGSIPAELGNLTNLKILGLANNNLSGSIPTELANLTNLTLLSLANNQLTAADTELVTFLNSNAENWATTQIIPTPPIVDNNSGTTPTPNNGEPNDTVVDNTEPPITPTPNDDDSESVTNVVTNQDTTSNDNGSLLSPEDEVGTPTTVTEFSCPMYSHPAPGWCKDGLELPPIKYKNGCLSPPRCVAITMDVPAINYISCPTNNSLKGICNAGGRTITKLEILEHGNLSNAVLDGQLTNHGRVSNLIITKQGFVSGGIITGYIKNEGTMENFEFVGGSIIGGTLAGIIINSSKVGGYFQDVYLAPKTQISGGYLIGKIIGDKKAPAELEKLSIKANSHIENVIISELVNLAENMTFGAGVRFTDNDLIPEGTDLTATLTTDGEIDFSTDVVTDAPNLLNQINALPDMQDNNWQLEQNADRLEVMVDGTRMRVKPKRVKQAKRNRRAEIIIHDDGTVTVITAKGREILVEVEALE